MPAHLLLMLGSGHDLDDAEYCGHLDQDPHHGHGRRSGIEAEQADRVGDGELEEVRGADQG